MLGKFDQWNIYFIFYFHDCLLDIMSLLFPHQWEQVMRLYWDQVCRDKPIKL